MKVCISIPIDLRLHNTGEFSVNKQISEPDGGVAWETVFSTNAVSGGEYLATLEPGRYQKVLGPVNGVPTFSSVFEIVSNNTYIDEEGTVFKIMDDGKLI
jgi:hypothetical protein